MQLAITPTDEGYQLEGELDMATADRLADVLRAALEEARHIVLDFSAVSFMDSSGLRVLLEAAGKQNGTGPLVVRDPSSQVRRVLDISIPGGAPGLEVRG
jgi:anti-anti-sigma factor